MLSPAATRTTHAGSQTSSSGTVVLVVVVEVEVDVEVVEVEVDVEVVEVVEVVASVGTVSVVPDVSDEVDVTGAMSAGLDCTAELHAVANTSATVAAARPSIMRPDGSGNPPHPDRTQIANTSRTATVSLMRTWRSVVRGLG
jgi:hypothetical protein